MDAANDEGGLLRHQGPPIGILSMRGYGPIVVEGREVYLAYTPSYLSSLHVFSSLCSGSIYRYYLYQRGLPCKVMA